MLLCLSIAFFIFFSFLYFFVSNFLDIVSFLISFHFLDFSFYINDLLFSKNESGNADLTTSPLILSYAEM